MEKVKVIFWDFDGVLMDSNPVREMGFRKVLADFPDNEVELLVDFHTINGGLSRYVKFRYFFETIRKEAVTENQINDWASRFSLIMKELLINPELLIKETVELLEGFRSKYKMHIVSGSDNNELNYLCDQLQISRFFDSIHGSPTPKTEWVRMILDEQGYDRSSCILIGDSINDLDAANDNGIGFLGYNNKELEDLSTTIVRLRDL